MEMEVVEVVYGDEVVIVDLYFFYFYFYIKFCIVEIFFQQVLFFLKIEILCIGDFQISVFGFFGVLGWL